MRVLVISIPAFGINHEPLANELPPVELPTGIRIGLVDRDRYAFLDSTTAHLFIEWAWDIANGVLGNFVYDLLKYYAAKVQHRAESSETYINGKRTDGSPASVGKIIAGVLENDPTRKQEARKVQASQDANNSKKEGNLPIRVHDLPPSDVDRIMGEPEASDNDNEKEAFIRAVLTEWAVQTKRRT